MSEKLLYRSNGLMECLWYSKNVSCKLASKTSNWSPVLQSVIVGYGREEMGRPEIKVQKV